MAKSDWLAGLAIEITEMRARLSRLEMTYREFAGSPLPDGGKSATVAKTRGRKPLAAKKSTRKKPVVDPNMHPRDMDKRTTAYKAWAASPEGMAELNPKKGERKAKESSAMPSSSYAEGA